MKWLCFMANMMVPGVGLLILKRWTKGGILTLFSLVAWGLVIPALILIFQILASVSGMYEGAHAEEFESLGEDSKHLKILIKNHLLQLVLGIVGLIILKVTVIWSQLATAQVFKVEKAAEAQETAAASVEVPPPLDSSN